MKREDVDGDLQSASFEFFFCYSRFEFALKENGYLKSDNVGDKADPSWETFKRKHCDSYKPSKDACRLIALHPKRQIIGRGGSLDWTPVGLDHCQNKNVLCVVVTMLQTIRNNLFHGGKHGDLSVDSKERNLELLIASKAVLDQLAKEADLESDYHRCY